MGRETDRIVWQHLRRSERRIEVEPFKSAATFSFLLFAAGAFFPVVPYFAAEGRAGTYWSFGLSAAALAGIGLATSLYSGRGPVLSVLRQVLIGAAAAGVTFGAGALMGISLA